MRRLIGLPAAIAMATLGLGAQAAPAAAQSSGTLFAAFGPAEVAKLDPATGALTPFADLSLPGQSAFAGDLASDPSHHRLYAIRAVFAPFNSSYQLLAIDTETGTVTPGPRLSEGVFDTVFDTSSGILYGQDLSCCPFHEVRIDAITGAVTNVADLPDVVPSFSTIDSSTHTIYKVTEGFSPGQNLPVFTMRAINDVTGAIASSPPLATGVTGLAFDSSSGTLFGKTSCCPVGLVRVNPVTGAETALGTFDLGVPLGKTLAVNASAHILYATEDRPFPKAELANIDAIDTQTGALISRAATTPGISSIVFVAPSITPQSIEADVSNALASGAIDNGGIASSLLIKLEDAAAARTAGDCTLAGEDYAAFINELSAQSGKHVAAATADKLISEAKFLIAHCP